MPGQYWWPLTNLRNIEIPDYCIEQLNKAGADKAQCVYSQGEKRELNVDAGEFSLFRTTANHVISLMVIKDQKKGWYSVTNPNLKIGFGLVYPVNIFRYLWYWQVFGGGYGYPWYGRTYKVGLEPFSSLGGGEPEPGSELRTDVKIKPGEQVSATIKAIIFKSEKGVKEINENGEIDLK